MDKNREILEDNVRYTFMSVVWSHKIQEKEADLLNEKFKCYETIRIVCSSLTSIGLISIIFVDEFWVKLISTLISFVSVSISMFFKSFEVRNNILRHKKTAVDLLVLRNKFRLLLLEINMNNTNTEELVQKYEELERELEEVYKEAPNTSDKAVEIASNALKFKKDNEFGDEEIDCNLPISLQRRSFNNNESKEI